MGRWPYAGEEEFRALLPGREPPEPERFTAASRQVDSLTFGRIPAAGGVEGLTDFQRALVTEAVCRQADFLAEQGRSLGLGLTAYAIGDVTVRFGQRGVYTAGGVTVPGEVWSLLRQTGLCLRTAGGGP